MLILSSREIDEILLDHLIVSDIRRNLDMISLYLSIYLSIYIKICWLPPL